MNTLPARFTHPHAELPTRAHLTDAGLDIAACETMHIAPGVVTLVPTGIAVAIPKGTSASSPPAPRWPPRSP